MSFELQKHFMNHKRKTTPIKLLYTIWEKDSNFSDKKEEHA